MTSREKGTTDKNTLVERIVERLPFRYEINSIVWGLMLYVVWVLLIFALASAYPHPLPGEFMAEAVGGAFSCLLYSVVALLFIKRVRRFFWDVREKVTSIVDKNELQTFNVAFEKAYEKISSKKFLLISLLWFVGYLVLTSRFVYEVITTVSGPTTAWIIGYLCIAWADLCWIFLVLIIGTSLWTAVTIYRFMRKFALLKLNLKPLDPDRMGGLKPFSTLSLNNSVLVSILCLMLPAAFGFPIKDIALWSATIFLVFLTLLFFFGPLFEFHSIMKDRKHKEMNIWSDIFQTSIEQIRKEIHEDPKLLENQRVSQNARLFREIFLEIEKMKEWPLDFIMLAKLLGPVIVPVLLYLLEKYLPALFQLSSIVKFCEDGLCSYVRNVFFFGRTCVLSISDTA